MASLTPPLPSTANLKEECTQFRLFCSHVHALIGFLFTKILLLFCRSNEEQIPWPIKDGKELPLSETITIVTGANSGIGYEIAKAHFQKGSNVILACRNLQRGEDAMKSILNESNNPESSQDSKRLQVLICDTSSIESVHAFVRRFKAIFKGKKVDFLFLNAGIVQKPYDTERFTKDGLEVIYASNFLGHFLLTGLLSASFANDVRIISTSALASVQANFNPQLAIHPTENRVELGFHTSKLNCLYKLISNFIPLDLFHFYGQGKAMQIAFSNILQNRFDAKAKLDPLQQRHRFTAAFHPGYVATNIFQNFIKPDQKRRHWIAKKLLGCTAISPKQGAQTGLWLAHTFDARPGTIHDRKKELFLHWYKTLDDQLANRLWQRWNNDAGLQESDWHF